VNVDLGAWGLWAGLVTCGLGFKFAGLGLGCCLVLVDLGGLGLLSNRSVGPITPYQVF
jgi:hypothetical protein